MIISGGDNELGIFVQERTPYFVKCFKCGVEISDWSKSSLFVKCLDWVVINGKLFCKSCALKIYEEFKQNIERNEIVKAIIYTENTEIFCYKFKINLKAGVCCSRFLRANEKNGLDSYYSECAECIQGKFVELFLSMSSMFRKAKVIKSSNIIF